MVGSPMALLAGTVVCLAAGALAGFINGCVVVYGRLQPIIATLATGAVYLGIALFLRPTPGGDIDKDLAWAFTNDLYELAATYGWFDDGDAAWFQPIAWIPVPLLLAVARGGAGLAAVPRHGDRPQRLRRRLERGGGLHVGPRASTGHGSPPSRWPASSPASAASTSRSRPRAAMPTCRRPAATR